MDNRTSLVEAARNFADAHPTHNPDEWMADFADLQTMTLLKFLTDIRFALGDDGKRMQDEFVEYCKEIKAERDRLREWVNGLEFASWDYDAEPVVLVRNPKTYSIITGNAVTVSRLPTAVDAINEYLDSKAAIGKE